MSDLIAAVLYTNPRDKTAKLHLTIDHHHQVRPPGCAGPNATQTVFAFAPPHTPPDGFPPLVIDAWWQWQRALAGWQLYAGLPESLRVRLCQHCASELRQVTPRPAADPPTHDQQQPDGSFDRLPDDRSVVLVPPLLGDGAGAPG